MDEFSIYRTKADDEWEVSFPSGTRLKTRILRLAEKYPDQVKNLIVNKDGSIFATIPIKWVRINPPKQVSERQIEVSRENIMKIHSAKMPV